MEHMFSGDQRTYADSPVFAEQLMKNMNQGMNDLLRRRRESTPTPISRPQPHPCPLNHNPTASLPPPRTPSLCPGAGTPIAAGALTRGLGYQLSTNKADASTNLIPDHERGAGATFMETFSLVVSSTLRGHVQYPA